MTIPVNAAKSGVQNLYDLANAAFPGKGFTDANITPGAPVAITGGGDNTSVVFTALSNKGFSGSVTREQHPL